MRLVHTAYQEIKYVHLDFLAKQQESLKSEITLAGELKILFEKGTNDLEMAIQNLNAALRNTVEQSLRYEGSLRNTKREIKNSHQQKATWVERPKEKNRQI